MLIETLINIKREEFDEEDFQRIIGEVKLFLMTPEYNKVEVK